MVSKKEWDQAQLSALSLEPTLEGIYWGLYFLSIHAEHLGEDALRTDILDILEGQGVTVDGPTQNVT